MEHLATTDLVTLREDLTHNYYRATAAIEEGAKFKNRTSSHLSIFEGPSAAIHTPHLQFVMKYTTIHI